MNIERQGYIGFQRRDSMIVPSSPASYFNTTLSGFTLIELLVSMALISSVLMLGLFTYRTFIQFHHRYDVRLNDATELSRLRYQLNRDLQQAATCFLSSPNTLSIEDREGQILVQYLREEQVLVRLISQRRDSFYLDAQWIESTIGIIKLVDTKGLWQIPVQVWPRSTATIQSQKDQSDVKNEYLSIFSPISVDLHSKKETDIIEDMQLIRSVYA